MYFSTSDLIQLRKLAASNNIEEAALLALISVESGGVVGSPDPVIRFEGHYFDRLLPPEQQAIARSQGLASPKVGAVKNPATMPKRYELLNRAVKINREAAIMSTSWGVGQVMGSHWKTLGFKTIEEFLKANRSGLVGQVFVMIQYLKKFGLIDALAQQDWQAVARGYNGPAFAKNKYDEKLARAYSLYSGGATPQTSNLIRLGSKGAAVGEIQRLLVRAGYNLRVDRDFGPATRETVKAFQQKHNLTVDGLVGPRTMAELLNYEALGEDLNNDNFLESSSGKIIVAGGATATAAVALQKELMELAELLLPLSVKAAGVITSVAAIIPIIFTLYGVWTRVRS